MTGSLTALSAMAAEFASDNTWKSYSTKCGYESYLKNGICTLGKTTNYSRVKTMK